MYQFSNQAGVVTCNFDATQRLRALRNVAFQKAFIVKEPPIMTKNNQKYRTVCLGLVVPDRYTKEYELKYKPCTTQFIIYVGAPSQCAAC